MANQDGEGFLTRIYKNLFVPPSDIEAIENEIKTEKVLNEFDGIYDAKINRKLDFNVKGSIFSGIEDAKATRVGNKRGLNRKTAKNNENTFLNASILENINLHKGEKPPETGNRFDELT
ncbi:MAG: hypothetical protein GX568_05355 [Candidatus Gastranaerophilales bacterium]|nr:hypothetical protein [Candidatus Gastranaerophilales bacterium]